jgi:hypothetical protein
VLTSIRGYVGEGLPLQLEGPSQISLFPYDNGTFVLESFRATTESVNITTADVGKHLRNLASGDVIEGKSVQTIGRRSPAGPTRTSFAITLLPHSYAAFALEPDTSGK